MKIVQFLLNVSRDRVQSLSRQPIQFLNILFPGGRYFETDKLMYFFISNHTQSCLLATTITILGKGGSQILAWEEEEENAVGLPQKCK